MLPLALGALSSSLDALLGASSSSSSSSSARGTGDRKFDPFDMLGGQASRDRTSSSSPFGNGPQIAPQTMRALLALQNQTQTQGQSPTGKTAQGDKWDPLQNLFSLIDGNGDGKVTKSEFESALGAGGTNLAKADEVFGRLDTNGDSSVTLDELSSALKGGRGHHHHHAAQAGGDGADPMAQALSGASSSQTTNGDGSTTTTLTFADGSKVTMTSAPKSSSSATSSYNFIERLIQNQAQALASQASGGLGISA